MKARDLLIGFALVSCQAQSAQTLSIDESHQTGLHLTVYDRFALVRDTREMVMPEGELLLEFEDVAQSLIPSSVMVKPSSPMEVFEQSYRYDLLNRESLLETYIGRKLKYSRTILQGGSYEKMLREGVLLSINPEIVDFGDEIEISPEGVISLPDVPDGLTLSPTLHWRVNNRQTGEQTLTASYIANQIGWSADYVISMDEHEETFSLNSWATVYNNSGAQFENASIRLIAGELNHDARPQPKMMLRAEMALDATASQGMQNEPSNIYQAFNMPQPVNLLHHEAKQIQFVSAKDVTYRQTFVVRGAVTTYPMNNQEGPAVETFLVFDNDADSNLGLPLAAGKVRIYRDSKRAPDLLGEANIGHTPVGEEVTLKLGRAFDVTAKRFQKDFARLSNRSFEVSYEVSLSNASSEPVEVTLQEMMQGDWRIQESSKPIRKVSSQLAEVVMTVPSQSTEVFSYRVRIDQ